MEVAPLFDHNSGPLQLRDATLALMAELAEASGLSDESNAAADNQETMLPSGKAISPVSAASCVRDYPRTCAFLRGVDAAVRTAQTRFEGRIHLLYAGCGPYATLALPLARRFTPSELGVTLVDIHPRSLESARACFAAMGCSDYLMDTHCGDAASYQHLGAPFHLVVTETMQRALVKEPQLAISANLAPQLPPGGLLVPELIKISLVGLDPRTEFGLDAAAQRIRFPLHPEPVMALRADNAATLLATAPDFEIGIPVLKQPLTAALQTHIVTGGPHALTDYESGLTYPVLLHELGRLRGGERIRLRYDVGPTPGFVATRGED